MDTIERSQQLFGLLLQNGGMGVGISDVNTAKAFAGPQCAGVVSLTLAGSNTAQKLAFGDTNRLEALEIFGQLYAPEVAAYLKERYWRRSEYSSKLGIPRPSIKPSVSFEWLSLFGAWSEVFLAQQGHEYPIGVNILTDVFWSHPWEIAAAGWALALRPEVLTYIVSGAGISGQYASMAEQFYKTQNCQYVQPVQGGDPFVVRFSIDTLMEKKLPNGVWLSENTKKMLRTAPYIPPAIVPIVNTMPAVIAVERELRRYGGTISAYAVEAYYAGGHAPLPRSKSFSPTGEPQWSNKDNMDWETFRVHCEKRGLPWWIAGDQGSPGALEQARKNGAVGVAIGSLAALCVENGMREDLRNKLFIGCRNNTVRVITMRVSPTGYLFNVVLLDDELSEEAIQQEWQRSCDIGFLHKLFWHNNTLVTRCPADKIAKFIKHGGTIEETDGIACLCRRLSATAGFKAVTDLSRHDFPIVTAGLHLVAQAQAWFTAKNITRADQCTISSLKAYMGIPV